MARRNAKRAKLIQTLVFYDGPQLALFETDQGLKLIATAVGEPSIENRFFGVEILDKAFRAYKNGRIDLNFLFKYSTGRRYYSLDWSSMSDENDVLIMRSSDAEINNPNNYPDRGFFEEDHTEEWINDTAPSAKKRFGIDGRWEASDFSKFYNKLGDIYSFLSIAEDLDNPDIGQQERQSIEDSIVSPSWRGGGSYVGFYSDITSHAQNVRPLRVSGMVYHSPGHIEVEGRQTVFDRLNETTQSFQDNAQKLQLDYTFIHRLLQFYGLNTSDKLVKFNNDEAEAAVLDRSRQLANGMGIPNIQLILKASGDNTIIFSKIILSYYRRLRDLVNFQKEGRITLAEPGPSVFE